MKKIVTLFAILAAPVALQAQVITVEAASPASPARPKLVVNIVLGGVSGERLDGFRAGFSTDGFARFTAKGTTFAQARYGYMQTTSPAGIATITTGVDPSMHGIVAPAWIDYVTGTRVALVEDPEAEGVGGDAGTGRYSPLHVVMPTLGDRLLAASSGSKVVSIAADPASAIVAGGQSGTAYWMDPDRAVWVTSTAYREALPDWVTAANTARPANRYVESGWTPARPVRTYVNTANTVFGGEGGGARIVSFRRGNATDYGAMLRTPLGNTLVADFARRVVEGEGLGADDAVDMLNVTFDASRTVGETYGGASMEVEDMLYRLDMDLADMVRAITAQVGGPANVLFTLTSDHGMSDTSPVPERFNVPQFRTILNSFLVVQLGVGDWVLDYIDRQVYLNRNLIYQRNLNLEDVQNRAAAFVLQFRGVSHVLTSTALSGGYFGAGWGERMQRGFYPRRAGDLTLNLMPGWIEERPGVKSLSGSMYDYDTHVPLVLWGWKIEPGLRVEERVDMTSLAPTLARIMGIGRPTASNGDELPLTINR
jgi:predicted AlkP superfamily pyrophosphatase or phosphodiesterase